jgi:hypothetical protein
VKTRIVMAVSFILALGATWLLTARRVVHATPGNVTLVAPGVWFREGDLKGLGHCNNIWIEMNDYVIVVDANFPSGAEACLADVKKTTRKPVKYVFDTTIMAITPMEIRSGPGSAPSRLPMSAWPRR